MKYYTMILIQRQQKSEKSYRDHTHNQQHGISRHNQVEPASQSQIVGECVYKGESMVWCVIGCR